MKFRYLIAALLLSLATGCVQEKIGTLSEIQVSESYVSIDVKGGEDAIDIVANYGMQVAEAADGNFRIVKAVTNKVDREFFRRETDRLREALKEAHRFIYRSDLNRTQALERVENDVEQFDEIKELVAFYRHSQRGVA